VFESYLSVTCIITFVRNVIISIRLNFWHVPVTRIKMPSPFYCMSLVFFTSQYELSLFECLPLEGQGVFHEKG
jgi:hypothetical protein